MLTDWDKMANLHRGPSRDAFYDVSVHLTQRFQRRRFIFEIDKPVTGNPYGDHACRIVQEVLMEATPNIEVGI